MNYSVSEENYIKAIYHLQTESDMVTTNSLAAELKTRPASVTDMMKKLKTKKLIRYQPYYGFRLSPEGTRIAVDIIRRHRLWEYFLSEKLKFEWTEVHEVAEQLEHVSSKKLIDKLDEYLQFPKFDPHGDPIPDSNGHIEKGNAFPLPLADGNKPVLVTHVANQSNDMLELLSLRNIGIGTKLILKKKYPFDNSIELKIKNQASFTISETLAKNIFVQYESQDHL